MSELSQSFTNYLQSNYSGHEFRKLTWNIRINPASELAEITIRNKRGNIHTAWIDSNGECFESLLIGGKTNNYKPTEYIYVKFGSRSTDIPYTIKKAVLNFLQSVFAAYYSQCLNSTIGGISNN